MPPVQHILWETLVLFVLKEEDSLWTGKRIRQGDVIMLRELRGRIYQEPGGQKQKTDSLGGLRIPSGMPESLGRCERTFPEKRKPHGSRSTTVRRCYPNRGSGSRTGRLRSVTSLIPTLQTRIEDTGDLDSIP
jgi:hypothetical protein